MVVVDEGEERRKREKRETTDRVESVFNRGWLMKTLVPTVHTVRTQIQRFFLFRPKNDHSGIHRCPGQRLCYHCHQSASYQGRSLLSLLLLPGRLDSFARTITNPYPEVTLGSEC